MKKLAPYRKAIIGAVSSFFAMLTKCLGDGNLSAPDIAQITGATVLGGITVYLMPNSKQARAVGN